MRFIDYDNLRRYSEGRRLLELGSSRFNAVYESAFRTMMSMSERVGWRGKFPLSFEGFSGRHIECTPESVSLVEGDNVLGGVYFTPEARVVVSGEIFVGLNDRAVCRVMSESVLSEDNLQMAAGFCSLGRFKVSGFHDFEKDAEYFISRPEIPGFNEALSDYCEKAYGSAPHLVSENEYKSLLRAARCLSEDLFRVSVRNEDPAYLEFEYDGVEVRDLADFFLASGDKEKRDAYVLNRHLLLGICTKLNHSLVMHSSLSFSEDREKLYHFPNANYLLMSGESPSMSLCSAQGTAVRMLVSPSVIPMKTIDTPCFKVVEFPDCEGRYYSLRSLEEMLKGELLSEENIRRMDDDLRQSGMMMSSSQIFSEDRSEQKDIVHQTKMH